MAQKQLSAMERKISLLPYSFRNLYIKKKKRQEMKASKQTKPKAKSKQQATKLNKGRNSRNSHGKTEFLESDEFYPFLVVT